MKRPIKSVIGVMLAGLLLVAATACSAPAAAQDPDTDGTPRTIVVTGTGTAYGNPDTATIQIGVQTRNTDPGQAVSENTTKVQGLIDVLKAQGIAEADLQTSNFSLYAQQDYDPVSGQPRETITYFVDNTLSITVRDINNLGNTLSAAVDAGANNIYNVAFSAADVTALEGQARDKAMADARARAEALAQAAGVTLDQVLTVSESSYGAQPPIVYGRGGADMQETAAVPIQTGQIQVNMQVYVTYTIN
jgi:uncharacterized protein YggE